MAVEMLYQEELQPKLRAVPTNPSLPNIDPPQQPRAVAPQSSGISPANAVALGILRVFAQILAVRFLLLAVLLGGFTLAYMAMSDPSYHGLWVFVAFSLLAVLPMVWLDRTERRK